MTGADVKDIKAVINYDTCPAPQRSTIVPGERDGWCQGNVHHSSPPRMHVLAKAARCSTARLIRTFQQSFAAAAAESLNRRVRL
jgi:hypothetical protein